MSEKLKNKLNIIKERFNDFTSFIELEDFRAYLLFTLTSQVPSNILAQLGMGGAKNVVNLPYNPLFNIYYQKINLMGIGSLILYVKSDLLKDDFIIEKDDPIFKKYLNENEMGLAFRGKEKILVPKVSDCSSFKIDGHSLDLNIALDDLFHTLESFITITEPNILFVVDAKNGTDPDVLFSFNMMPELPGNTDEKVLKIDAFLDYDHKTKDITYLKREEDLTLVFMKDINEINHADLYKSSFSLIVHIKSFNKAY